MAHEDVRGPAEEGLSQLAGAYSRATDSSVATTKELFKLFLSERVRPRSRAHGCSGGGGTKAELKPRAAGNEAAVGRTPVRTHKSIAPTAVRICGPVRLQ